MSAPTVGALFAGYGGIELALHEVLGARPAWFSEFDAAPSAILAHRYPDVPNLGDVTAIKWTPDCPTCGAQTQVQRSPGALALPVGYACTADPAHVYGLHLRDQQQRETGVAIAEPVDLVTGGSPCQDLSAAGKRAGMVPGTRSGLWASMVEAIRLICPSLVLWENVRGALTAEGEPATPEVLALESDRDRTRRALETVRRRQARAQHNGETTHVAYHARDAIRLARRHERQVGAVRRARRGLVRAVGRVVGDLAELGYDAAWVGLRAADVGAPHGRFRIFVLAWPANRTGEAVPWAVDQQVAPTPADRRTGDVAAPGGQLMPTPRATDGSKGGPNQRGSSGDLMLPSAVMDLLPTPLARDFRGTAENAARQGGTDLPGALALLRTPTAQLAVNGGSQHPDKRKAGGHGPTLADEVEHMLPTPTCGDAIGTRNDVAYTWGDYGRAVERWEAVTRPAPAPTEPTGKGGSHRLSPAFVEWLMGLPAGWVTDPAIGITRNEQLKALGNGVVPQQCAAAVRHLLAVRDMAEAVAA